MENALCKDVPGMDFIGRHVVHLNSPVVESSPSAIGDVTILSSRSYPKLACTNATQTQCQRVSRWRLMSHLAALIAFCSVSLLFHISQLSGSPLAFHGLPRVPSMIDNAIVFVSA